MSLVDMAASPKNGNNTCAMVKSHYIENGHPTFQRILIVGIQTPTTGLITIPTVGKQWEFRLTCVHIWLHLGILTLQRNSTEWRFGCGSPVLVVTATGWGQHPKIRPILSLRSWMNNVTLSIFVKSPKWPLEQIPNTRIFRSFLGTDFPRKANKNSHVLTYEDGH